MTKKRSRAPEPKLTVLAWVFRSIRRNPIASLASGVTIFIGIPGAVAAYEYIDPIIPALHYYVRELIQPVQYQTNQQAVSIDRLLLIYQQQQLEKAQADMKAAPSGTVADKVDALKESVTETKARICKVTGKGCGS